MKRLASRKKSALLWSYLSSDLAGYMTGATLNINGGLYYQ
jgi:acetoacetyl-CoA reductase